MKNVQIEVNYSKKGQTLWTSFPLSIPQNFKTTSDAMNVLAEYIEKFLKIKNVVILKITDLSTKNTIFEVK